MKQYFYKQAPSSFFWYFFAEDLQGNVKVLKIDPSQVGDLENKYEFKGMEGATVMPRLKEKA